MSKRQLIGFCSVFGCGKSIEIRGLCKTHYTRWWMHGRTHKVNSEKRTHPFYALWFDRKRSGALADEWLDFHKFVADISPKPDGNYFLVRLRGDEPYGPTNFKWQEHLKRKPGESKKNWWARKWQARHAGNRSIERRRDLKRRFGITPEQFQKMLDAQNGICAICGNPETATDPKTGSLRNLAVDHCHKTKKIRALLCFRCNGTVGKLEERPDLARKIVAYIEQHSEGLNA